MKWQIIRSVPLSIAKYTCACWLEEVSVASELLMLTYLLQQGAFFPGLLIWYWTDAKWLLIGTAEKQSLTLSVLSGL